ncbi:hypothetical protein SK128_005607 [Halocaridina rubra]|uniref:Uncharacterized protein n=1 Tax=Halocaridina rubra TaxID=373956 RepID=A0AAN8XI10_HALRR
MTRTPARACKRCQGNQLLAASRVATNDAGDKANNCYESLMVCETLSKPRRHFYNLTSAPLPAAFAKGEIENIFLHMPSAIVPLLSLMP